MPSAKAVKRAAVVTHGKPQTIGPALARLTTVAREAGVELRMGEQEAEKHGLDPENGNGADVDIAVVLGGDGTMLRALNRFLGTGVPVIGVNFGRVGFLSSIARDDLEAGLPRSSASTTSRSFRLSSRSRRRAAVAVNDPSSRVPSSAG
jgi:NAD+ kinase